MPAISQPPNGTTKGRWIPWSIAAMFVPVFAVNIYLAHVALSSSTGLVTENAYDTGQSYNRVISHGRQQAALGWRAIAAFEAVPPAGNGTVTGTGTGATLRLFLFDSQGAPIRDAVITGQLLSPVDPQPVQPLALLADGQGQYRQIVTLPRHGQWEISAVAHRDSADFVISQRVILP